MDDKKRLFIRELGMLALGGSVALPLRALGQPEPSIDDRLADIETAIGQTGPIQSQLNSIISATNALQAKIDDESKSIKESIDALTKTMGEVRRASFGDPTGRSRLGGA